MAPLNSDCACATPCVFMPVDCCSWLRTVMLMLTAHMAVATTAEMMPIVSPSWAASRCSSACCWMLTGIWTPSARRSSRAASRCFCAPSASSASIW